ncbi:LysR family transcriptional regulator [Bradyrhizobium sp. 2S1]|uniref:LysR family transcriptional regulator n=1 Tax=Bradyrhizobium sp. 2S1 TaxID=1404429 RepID=UPI00158E66E2|nr:LysR family transcriptional regulator [Bradyrhizobium sp. 2S1]
MRYVIAAAQYGSFRAAAIALGVRASAISRRIRDLEDAIGVALFIRHHGGVSLTYAGERFFNRTREALNQISYAARDAGAAGRGEQGALQIGIFAPLAPGFLMELLQAYALRNPDIRPDVIEGDGALHIAAIQQHRLDIAFLPGHPTVPNCDVAHLWNERVFVILPSGHQLSTQEEVIWPDLRDRHFIVTETEPGPKIHDYLVTHLVQMGHHPTVERCPVYRETLMQLVAVGRGLSLTTAAATAVLVPGVVFRPLVADELPFSAIWSPRNDNPALRRLLSLAKAMSRTMLPGLLLLLGLPEYELPI